MNTPRPYTIAIPDHDLADLHDRLARTRWPHPLADAGWERGVPLDYLQQLTSHWHERFDWRAQERALNAYPQFVAEIDGQPIHFLHVTSPEPDAMPLLLTHGWPSTPAEFVPLVAPLTDPAAHGGDWADAFHLVIPSLPGYGFSTPVDRPGWGNLFRVAQAWDELMAGLGYDRYAVHGVDVGSGVSGILAMLAPTRVVGVHLAGTTAAMPFGPPLELDGLSERDRRRAERFNEFQETGMGYLHLQATRPQTLAYALTDSPVGQLAWIVDRFWALTDPVRELPEDAVGIDALLTTVSISWFTRSGASSANAVYDGMQAWRAMLAQEPPSAGAADDVAAATENAPPSPPTGVAVFAADTTIRSVMDPEGRIQHWSEFDRGGHFPALETPALLTEDLRTFFRPLRAT